MIIKNIEIPKTEYLWNPSWQQPFETFESLIDKFKFVNEISDNYFNNVLTYERQQKILMSTLGFTQSEYQEKLEAFVFSRIGNEIERTKTIDECNKFCPVCKFLGFQSIFHKVIIFDHCIYHPTEKLEMGDKLQYQSIYNQKFTINEIFSIWSKKIEVRDKKYFEFIDLQPIFKDEVESNQTVYIEGIKADNIELQKSILNDRILESSPKIKILMPALYETKSLMKWWERQRRQKIFLSRKVQYGRLILSNNPSKSNLIKEIQNKGFKKSHKDIDNSINHYLIELLSEHHQCIKKEDNSCIVSTFYRKYIRIKNRAMMNFHLFHPNWNDSAYAQIKHSILRDFVRTKRYVFDEVNREYDNPINHISEDVLNTDVVAFHVYHDIACFLMVMVLDKLNIPNNLHTQELKMVHTSNKVLIYSTRSIKDITETLLNYCDSQNSCMKCNKKQKNN